MQKSMQKLNLFIDITNIQHQDWKDCSVQSLFSPILITVAHYGFAYSKKSKTQASNNLKNAYIFV